MSFYSIYEFAFHNTISQYGGHYKQSGGNDTNFRREILRLLILYRDTQILETKQQIANELFDEIHKVIQYFSPNEILNNIPKDQLLQNLLMDVYLDQQIIHYTQIVTDEDAQQQAIAAIRQQQLDIIAAAPPPPPQYLAITKNNPGPVVYQYSPYKGQHSLRILYIEDTFLHAKIVIQPLIKKGHIITHCENKEFALNEINVNYANYDIVLTDIDYPIMNGGPNNLGTGIIFAKQLRGYELLHNLGRKPIIGYSSNDYSVLASAPIGSASIMDHFFQKNNPLQQFTSALLSLNPPIILV